MQHTKGNKQLFLEVCCPSVFSAGLINGWDSQEASRSSKCPAFYWAHPPPLHIPASTHFPNKGL